MSLEGLNPKCWQGLFFLDVPGQNLFLDSPRFQRLLHSWAHHSILCFCWHSAFSFNCLLPSCYKVTVLHQNPPGGLSPHLEILNLPKSAMSIFAILHNICTNPRDQDMELFGGPVFSLPQLHYGILSMTQLLCFIS